jgi:DNA-binding CsgD family transcriptional regulator
MLAYARTDVGSADVGLVVLDPETFSVVSINATGERMLAQLSGLAGGFHPPLVVEAVARRALAAATTGSGDDVGATPMVRCRAPGGEWLTIHASLLAAGDGSEQVGVVLERAGAAELASLVLKAFDLTAREQTVAELVLRGYSTRQIVDELHISAHTVQDHLKSVFAKFGVGSRRELVASLLSGNS